MARSIFPVAVEVLRLAGEGYLDRAAFADFESMPAGLAFHPDGRLLVCVSGHGLAAVDSSGKQTWLHQAGDQPLNCLTSVTAAPDGSIFRATAAARTCRKIGALI